MTTRISLVALALSLGACTKEPPQPPDQTEPAVRPAQPGPAPGGEPCASAPAWSRLTERCEAEGFVYGVGRAAEIPNPSIRVHVASDRARGALVDVGTTVLVHSEVLDLAQCDGSSWALARRPLLEGDPSFAECGDVIEARAEPMEGCPEWSTALATLEGERVHGVGYVIGMKNAQMARTVASNRAIAEQRKTLGVQVTRGDDGSVSAGTASQVVALQEGAEVQTCGTVTVAKVTSRILNP